MEDWFERRQQRQRQPGTIRLVPLAPGVRAAHLQPDAPRLVLERDGWQGDRESGRPLVVQGNYLRFVQGATPGKFNLQDSTWD